MAPRNAYFELVAQPARITPYTPAELSASKYNKPALMSATAKPGHKGTTAHAASAGITASSGAMRNRNLLEAVGTTISFSISFSTSANGCNKPPGPTRFGP